MKHFCLSLLCLFWVGFSPVFAQDKGYKVGFYGAYNQHPIIESNKQLSSGGRWVKGSAFITTIKNSSLKEGSKINCNIGLSVERCNDGPLDYFFDVLIKTTDFGNLNVFKDSPLLIKLSNGDVIRLKCRDDVADKIGQVVSVMYNVTLYSVIAQYQISSADIDRFKNGVVKVRFEANAEKWDFDFRRHKKDELGEFLYKEKALITGALNNQTDFDEDF